MMHSSRMKVPRPYKVKGFVEIWMKKYVAKMELSHHKQTTGVQNSKIFDSAHTTILTERSSF